MSGPPAETTPVWLAAVRPLLAVAYLSLSHLATARESHRLAALAVGLIVLLLLTEPLWQRRAWAWIVTVIAAVALWMLKDSAHIHIALLLMPVFFLLLLAWLFGRTLMPGRIPVIGKIVRALEGGPDQEVSDELDSYTRGLTALWTGVFIALALINLTLALVASPGGLLIRAGMSPPWSISDSQWSWFANWLNYGLVGIVFAVEFAYRKHRFPDRYKNALHFFRQMASLGPKFWRDIFK